MEIKEMNKRVAVVTGGYGHLGKSICQALAEMGALVVVCGRNREKYTQAFSKEDKNNIHFFKMDVSSTVSIKNAFRDISRQYGSIDILVNNAFYSQGRSPEAMTDKEWATGIDGVLNSGFRCLREIIPYMKRRKSGNIINIASMYGLVSPVPEIYKDYPEFFNPPHYGAAKAGLIQLTKYYAVYLAKHNIRVNCISPGAFPSPSVRQKKGFIKMLSAKIPMGRIGSPEEIKGAVVFLASGMSSYVTGQNIIVDGGWTAW
jgi:NAD(P)-dependent dehydrogenase (short-subunit alcohol dehydrogenase family)